MKTVQPKSKSNQTAWYQALTLSFEVAAGAIKATAAEFFSRSREEAPAKTSAAHSEGAVWSLDTETDEMELIREGTISSPEQPQNWTYLGPPKHTYS